MAVRAFFICENISSKHLHGGDWMLIDRIIQALKAAGYCQGAANLIIKIFMQSGQVEALACRLGVA
jgi:hypothetical protein